MKTKTEHTPTPRYKAELYQENLFTHSGHKVKPSNDDKNNFEWFCETCNYSFKLAAKIEPTQSEIKHTPVPWKICEADKLVYGGLFVVGPDDVGIWDVEGVCNKDADAEFIVRACNNFEALVTGIQAALIHLTNEKVKEMLRNILAQAEAGL